MTGKGKASLVKEKDKTELSSFQKLLQNVCYDVWESRIGNGTLASECVVILSRTMLDRLVPNFLGGLVLVLFETVRNGPEFRLVCNVR